jgi:hypothetical protein
MVRISKYSKSLFFHVVLSSITCGMEAPSPKVLMSGAFKANAQ